MTAHSIIPNDGSLKPLQSYAELRNYFGAVLNQDYDIFGESPDEVAAYYRDNFDANSTSRLATQMQTFLAQHEADSDEEFSDSFKQEVPGGVGWEAWKQQTLREFLQDQIEILRAPRQGTG